MVSLIKSAGDLLSRGCSTATKFAGNYPRLVTAGLAAAAGALAYYNLPASCFAAACIPKAAVCKTAETPTFLGIQALGKLFYGTPAQVCSAPITCPAPTFCQNAVAAVKSKGVITSLITGTVGAIYALKNLLSVSKEERDFVDYDSMIASLEAQIAALEPDAEPIDDSVLDSEEARRMAYEFRIMSGPELGQKIDQIFSGTVSNSPENGPKILQLRMILRAPNFDQLTISEKGMLLQRAAALNFRSLVLDLLRSPWAKELNENVLGRIINSCLCWRHQEAVKLIYLLDASKDIPGDQVLRAIADLLDTNRDEVPLNPKSVLAMLQMAIGLPNFAKIPKEERRKEIERAISFYRPDGGKDPDLHKYLTELKKSLSSSWLPW